MLQDLILRTELFGISNIPHPSWLIHLSQINLIALKCFAPFRSSLKVYLRGAGP